MRRLTIALVVMGLLTCLGCGREESTASPRVIAEWHQAGEHWRITAKPTHSEPNNLDLDLEHYAEYTTGGFSTLEEHIDWHESYIHRGEEHLDTIAETEEEFCRIIAAFRSSVDKYELKLLAQKREAARKVRAAQEFLERASKWECDD